MPPPWREPTHPSRPGSRGGRRRPSRTERGAGGGARRESAAKRRGGPEGGAGRGRAGPRRNPAPAPPPPASAAAAARTARAGGDACAPRRAACARGQKVRGGAGLRARPALAGARVPGRAANAVGAGARGEKKGECRFCDCWVPVSQSSRLQAPEGCREARRPLVCKVFLTASQTTVARFFPTATSGESCPLLTFYPRVPKDGILS